MARINEYPTSLIDRLSNKHELRARMRNVTTLTPITPSKKSTLDRNGREVTRFAVMPFYSRLTFKIEKILKNNGINVAFTNRGSVKEVLNKKKVKKSIEEMSGVYEILCEGGRDGKCDMKYRGQTKRPSRKRDKEHTRHVNSREVNKSSVAKHCVENGHKRGEMKLLKQVDNPLMLDSYESLYIAKCENLMNEGEPPISSSLFKFAL
jgi:hypothetical protein